VGGDKKKNSEPPSGLEPPKAVDNYATGQEQSSRRDPEVHHLVKKSEKLDLTA
jgi:hypothetical protein